MTMGNDFLNVFYGRDDDADNFGVQVFKLIAKADHVNLEKIEKGFPKQVALYRWWMAMTSPPSPNTVMMAALDLANGLDPFESVPKDS